MVVGPIVSDISPVKPSDISPRMTIGDRLNITVTLDQRNQVKVQFFRLINFHQPGNLDDIVWKQVIVCDQFNPFDNLCNIPGKKLVYSSLLHTLKIITFRREISTLILIIGKIRYAWLDA